MAIILKDFFYKIISVRFARELMVFKIVEKLTIVNYCTCSMQLLSNSKKSNHLAIPTL
jgi:hypothetical protein